MILVTGGTGMVGAHVLFECVKKKNKTRAIFRRKESLEKIKELFLVLAPEQPYLFDEIEWVQTDLNDLFNLENAFREVTYVYHCAAKVSFAQFHEEKLIKTNVEGTANVVNLCLKYNIRKLAYVSSIASLGAEKNIKLIDETNSWSNTQDHTPYAYSKYGAELEVWRASQEGLDVVILNPGVILGAHFWHRSSGTIIERVGKGLRYYLPGKTAVVALDDVVNVLILLMESSIKNERFILVSETIPQKVLLDKIADALNKKRPYFPLSKTLLLLIFIFEKTLDVLMLRKNFLSLSLVEALCNDQEYDGSKITSSLSFKYSDTDSVIKKIAAYY